MNPYAKFAIVMAVSLILMFVLTMSMVRDVDHFYLNLSNFYMALIMVAPMGLVMLIAMRNMFPNARINLGLGLAFIALFIGAFVMGRNEVFVGNDGFLRSMIPHHSRAILVCEESRITDPKIIDLCGRIIESQSQEIAEMKVLLEAER